MNWFYAQDNVPTGPITEEEFQDRVAKGVIQADTLVWKEGMPSWIPYGEWREQAGHPSTPRSDAPPVTGAAPPPADQVQCAQCRQFFPADDLVVIGGRQTCAACKPAYVQSLQEGATGWGSSAAMAGLSNRSHGTQTAEEIVARDYDVPVVELYSQGIRLFQQDPSNLVVAGILMMVVSWAIGAATAIFQIIPILGIVFSILIPAFIKGPIRSGLLLTYLRYLRGERVVPNDVFCTFNARFWKLAVANLVPTLLAALCYLPGLVLIILMAVGTSTAGGGGPPPATPLVFVGVIAMFIGMLVQVYLSISWIYTLPLVADRHFRVLDAMRLSRQVVGRHFWQHLWYLIFSAIVAFIGLLACGLGILVAMPLTEMAGCLLYERVFHGLESRENH